MTTKISGELFSVQILIIPLALAVPGADLGKPGNGGGGKPGGNGSGYQLAARNPPAAVYEQAGKIKSQRTASLPAAI